MLNPKDRAYLQPMVQKALEEFRARASGETASSVAGPHLKELESHAKGLSSALQAERPSDEVAHSLGILECAKRVAEALYPDGGLRVRASNVVDRQHMLAAAAWCVLPARWITSEDERIVVSAYDIEQSQLIVDHAWVMERNLTDKFREKINRDNALARVCPEPPEHLAGHPRQAELIRLFEEPDAVKNLRRLKPDDLTYLKDLLRIGRIEIQRQAGGEAANSVAGPTMKALAARARKLRSTLNRTPTGEEVNTERWISEESHVLAIFAEGRRLTEALYPRNSPDLNTRDALDRQKTIAAAARIIMAAEWVRRVKNIKVPEEDTGVCVQLLRKAVELYEVLLDRQRWHPDPARVPTPVLPVPPEHLRRHPYAKHLEWWLNGAPKKEKSQQPPPLGGPSPEPLARQGPPMNPRPPGNPMVSGRPDFGPPRNLGLMPSGYRPRNPGPPALVPPPDAGQMPGRTLNAEAAAFVPGAYRRHIAENVAVAEYQYPQYPQPAGPPPAGPPPDGVDGPLRRHGRSGDPTQLSPSGLGRPSGPPGVIGSGRPSGPPGVIGSGRPSGPPGVIGSGRPSGPPGVIGSGRPSGSSRGGR